MQDIQTLKRMLIQIQSILSCKQKIQMIGVFFIISIGSMLELLGVASILPFVQSILTPEKLMGNKYVSFFCSLFGVSERYSVIILVGVGIIAIFLIKNTFLVISNYIQVSYSNKTQRDLSILMIKSYMNRSYSFFVENGSSVVMQGVNADSTGVFMIMMNGFGLMSESLVVLLITIYLTSVDWILAIGVLSVGLVCLVVVVLGLKKRISKLSAVSRQTGVEKYSWLVQISGGIKDILVYNRQDYFLKGYENAYNKSCSAAIRFAWIGALPEKIIEAFCVSGIVATLLFRLQMGMDASTFIPSMATFAMGSFRLLPSISRTTGYINNFVYYRQYVEATYDNVKAARDFQKQQKKIAIDSTHFLYENSVDLKFKREIKVCGIRWKYPTGKDYVLDGFSLTIHKGEAVGIIGESGSGKSTIADIILRLYHPQSGSIMMDGIDIDSIPYFWSKVIGYVPQAVFLEDSSIRENVIFGADEYNDEKVWEALRKASLDSFVKGLPQGLDTLVGERGVKFSGGQRQRIAIARALYANPQILILDEATSALDNETEEAVMEAIDSLAGIMTLIIIAHRVTTLKSCDKIYEIICGKAVERDKNEVIRMALSTKD